MKPSSLKPWRILSSKLAFDHTWFKVRQDTVEMPSGKVIDDWLMWASPEISLIVPRTPQGELVFVHQYKHGVGKITYEFPAGFVDQGEEPITAARRELLEETNLVCDKLEPIGVFQNHPTKETGNLHIFFADSVRPSNLPPFVDDMVEIEVEYFNPKKVQEMINTGEISVAGSVVGFLLASQRFLKI